VINIKKIIIIILLSFFCFLNAWAGIKDGLFATVGNKAITKSDIVQEMKIILILNGESYSEENKERIRSAAIKSLIKRIIKQIEIEKYDFLKFNELDVYKEVDRVSKLRGIDSETLRNIFTSNDMDFSLVTKQIETELLWNSLIFEIYKERLSINVDEIEEQLKLIQNAEEIYEYLISEIIIKPLDQNNIETEIKNLKDRIKSDGFEKVAMDISISETAVKGGNLGWINENSITDNFKNIIKNTKVGDISEPIKLPEGILFFKINEKRKIDKFTNLEQAKNYLIESERTKMLNMYSLTHYDNLMRSLTVNYHK